MRTITMLLLMITVSSAIAELDFKQLAETKKDQPPAVTTVESISISVQFGMFEIPKGSTVKVDAFKPDGILDVEYNGQKYSIPASKTDLEGRVAEIRSHRIVVDVVEYEDFSFSNPTLSKVTLTHRTGVTRVPLSRLPQDWQKKLGYDPVKEQAAEAARIKMEEEQNAPLTGKDLVAWKLARQAAEKQAQILSTPVLAPEPTGAVTVGSLGGYTAIANARARAEHPHYELAPDARQKYMQKTPTGDWVFTFPVKSSYYNVQTKTRQQVTEKILANVTDLRSEIRVTETKLVTR